MSRIVWFVCLFVLAQFQCICVVVSLFQIRMSVFIYLCVLKKNNEYFVDFFFSSAEINSYITFLVFFFCQLHSYTFIKFELMQSLHIFKCFSFLGEERARERRRGSEREKNSSFECCMYSYFPPNLYSLFSKLNQFKFKCSNLEMRIVIFGAVNSKMAMCITQNFMRSNAKNIKRCEVYQQSG